MFIPIIFFVFLFSSIKKTPLFQSQIVKPSSPTPGARAILPSSPATRPQQDAAEAAGSLLPLPSSSSSSPPQPVAGSPPCAHGQSRHRSSPKLSPQPEASPATFSSFPPPVVPPKDPSKPPMPRSRINAIASCYAGSETISSGLLFLCTISQPFPCSFFTVSRRKHTTEPLLRLFLFKPSHPIISSSAVRTRHRFQQVLPMA